MTISGDNPSRIFFVNAGVNFTFSNLTITGGPASSGSGGGIFNQGNLTILNSTLTGNAASRQWRRDLHGWWCSQNH